MPVAEFPMHLKHAIEPGALDAYPIPQSVHVRLVAASVCPLVPGGHFSQNVPIGLCSPASQNCKMPLHIETSVFPVLVSIWNRPDGHTPSHFAPSTFPVDSSRCHVSKGHAPVHLALSTFPVEASFCHLPAMHAPSQSSAMLLAALDHRPCSHCVHAPGLSSAVTCWEKRCELLKAGVRTQKSTRMYKISSTRAASRAPTCVHARLPTRSAAVGDGEAEREEETRNVTHAFRIALRGRPIRGTASCTNLVVHTAPPVASMVEVVRVSAPYEVSPALILDQSPRLHAAKQHEHHPCHDEEPSRPHHTMHGCEPAAASWRGLLQFFQVFHD